MAKAAPKNQANTTTQNGYTVLARRYRPGGFSDLIGQEAISQVLTNAIKHNRVAHAYLFTGARGVGKTSAARILAKALNCEKGPSTSPCGTCSICNAIATGEDVDVLEIDGASNRGIDEVREIRNNVQYRPSRSRFKIYIIDEVHMLTGPAFNALLKTLEEPPAHVKFIFATTEVQKIPITILSRCQRFDFSSIGTKQIAAHLQEITSKEGLEAEPDAIELIARRAGGSMRDAQSLLDQALSFSNGKITRDEVHRLIGAVDENHIMDLAEAILKGESAKVLELMDQTNSKGLQMGELVEQMISFWRDLMVFVSSNQIPPDASIATSQHDRFKNMARAIPLDTVLAGLDVLSLTKMRLKATHQPRIMVEFGLIRLSRLANLIPVQQILQQLQSGGIPTVGQTPNQQQAASPEGLKKKLINESGGIILPQSEQPEVRLSSENISSIWPQVIELTGPMLGNELKKAGTPAISGPNALVIEFSRQYNQALEYCSDPARILRIQNALGKITGQSWVVRVASKVVTNPEELVEETPAVVEPVVSKPKVNPKDAAEKEPLVQRALEIFNAQIVRVDVGFGVPPPESKVIEDEDNEKA
ncbi:MAG: DNA polymerase III subunit gamma/tau [Gemmataceae bacterium]